MGIPDGLSHQFTYWSASLRATFFGTAKVQVRVRKRYTGA